VHGLVSFGLAMTAALILYLHPVGEAFALPILSFDRIRASLRSVPWPRGTRARRLWRATA
jgi:hypothetical protein